MTTKTIYSLRDADSGKPLRFYWIESSAIRAAGESRIYGYGSQLLEVTPTLAVKMNGEWFVPGDINTPEPGDEDAQLKLEAKRAAIQAAKDAGLPESVINALTS